jgi:hypothetical protein
MTRLTLALAALISVVSGVSASLAPLKERTPLENKVLQVQVSRLAPEVLQAVAEPAPTPEFVLTDRTEIRLNGRPCKYEEIPGHARIVLLEVAMDNRTVLKIHFRTGK